MGPEAKVESEIVAWAVANGGLALKLKIDGVRGFPDRTFLFPRGLALFLEVKKPRGGVVSQQQKKWIREIRRRGFIVKVVRTVEEAEKARLKAVRLSTIQQVRRLVKSGVGIADIAHLLGVKYQTVYQWADPERRRKYRRTFYDSPRGRLAAAVSGTETRAKQRGYTPCTWTIDRLLPTLTDTCECCGKSESEVGTLQLDHCHKTGDFRAWLCNRCNAGISKLNDDPATIRAAASLLERRIVE